MRPCEWSATLLYLCASAQGSVCQAPHFTAACGGDRHRDRGLREAAPYRSSLVDGGQVLQEAQ